MSGTRSRLGVPNKKCLDSCPRALGGVVGRVLGDVPDYRRVLGSISTTFGPTSAISGSISAVARTHFCPRHHAFPSTDSKCDPQICVPGPSLSARMQTRPHRTRPRHLRHQTWASRPAPPGSKRGVGNLRVFAESHGKFLVRSVGTHPYILRFVLSPPPLTFSPHRGGRGGRRSHIAACAHACASRFCIIASSAQPLPACVPIARHR